VYPINAVPLYWRVTKRINLTSAEYFRALWPGLHGTLVMVVGVVLLKLISSKIQLPVVSLSINIAGGVLFYLLTMVLFHRARVGILGRVFSLLRN
jgi:hypothetical protein